MSPMANIKVADFTKYYCIFTREGKGKEEVDHNKEETYDYKINY